MSRIRHFDIAKGIGIILVAIGHSAIELGHYLIYMFHMPLFFYLSGVFWRPDSLSNVIKKKSRGLLLPLVIFTAVLLTLGVAVGGLQGSLSASFPHMRGIVGPLWFLLSLFEVTVIYHAVASRCRPIVTLLICLTLTFALGYLPDIMGWDNYMYMFTSFSVLIFYALGALIGKNITFTKKRWLWIAMLASAVMFFGSYYVSYKMLHHDLTDLFSNTHTPNFIIWLIGSITGITMVLLTAMIIDTTNYVARFLAYLGECSLFIFAFHLVVIQLGHKNFPEGSLILEIGIITLAIGAGCLCRPLFQRLLPGVFGGGKQKVSKISDKI